jgi:hypothetical protein
MNAGTSVTSLSIQSFRELVQTVELPTWLWHGYLARGKMTALVSPPKSGKTTLLFHLLARLAQGGSLAGLTVTPGRAVVVSEEAAADWALRGREHPLGANIQFSCRPFGGARPTEAAWSSLIAGLETHHRQEPIDLVVIDPLATFLPGYAEGCGPKLLDCLLPLQALATQGPAVWLLHHPTKGRREHGQTARGTGALPGFVDIVMEMSSGRRAGPRDRRRRIRAYSRFAATPPQVIVELLEDGADYVVRTAADGTVLVESWPAVRHLLASVTCKLRMKDILDHWPVEDEVPDRSTLWRWLKRATQQGLIRRSGTGYRGDPFRYWLPGREPLLYPGDASSSEEKRAWKERCLAYQNGLLVLPNEE